MRKKSKQKIIQNLQKNYQNNKKSKKFLKNLKEKKILIKSIKTFNIKEITKNMKREHKEMNKTTKKRTITKTISRKINSSNTGEKVAIHLLNKLLRKQKYDISKRYDDINNLIISFLKIFSTCSGTMAAKSILGIFSTGSFGEDKIKSKPSTKALTTIILPAM